MEDVVSLTSELIEIPSHTDAHAAGDYLESWLRTNTDAAVHRDEVGNVMATKGTEGQTLALVGHHDVVPPATSQLDADGSPRATVDAGRLYGRGSADMKGALAAMMLAFERASPATQLTFASFVDEETGGHGAQHAVERGFAPEYAIIGEGSAGYATPGALDVVIAHRGRRGSTLTATGRATHASDPETGVNAVYRAIEAIERLRALERPVATFGCETMQGTLEVTGIEATGAMNVIPDRCTVTLDERTLPDVRISIAEAVDDLDGVSWTVDQDWPPMACSDDAFTEAVRAACSQAQATDVSMVTKPHATDASWLAQAGSATVVVGPAERGEAHTDTESVSIDLLEASVEGYLTVADTWSGS